MSLVCIASATKKLKLSAKKKLFSINYASFALVTLKLEMGTGIFDISLMTPCIIGITESAMGGDGGCVNTRVDMVKTRGYGLMRSIKKCRSEYNFLRSHPNNIQHKNPS